MREKLCKALWQRNCSKGRRTITERSVLASEAEQDHNARIYRSSNTHILDLISNLRNRTRGDKQLTELKPCHIHDAQLSPLNISRLPVQS